MSSVEILQANTEHLAELAPLFDAYRVSYGQASDLAGAMDFLSARLNKGESVIFLARDRGEPVGFTQLYPTFSSVSMRTAWILNDLFVAEIARRRGVGQQLMERARQHAQETQAKGLALETARDNHPAQALYERLGWKRDEAFFHYELLL